MTKSPLTVAGLKRLFNELEEVCHKACSHGGVGASAEAELELVGDYTMEKDGEFGLDVEVRGDVPDSVPVEAGGEESFGKDWGKTGKGQIRILLKLAMERKVP